MKKAFAVLLAVMLSALPLMNSSVYYAEGTEEISKPNA